MKRVISILLALAMLLLLAACGETTQSATTSAVTEKEENTVATAEPETPTEEETEPELEPEPEPEPKPEPIVIQFGNSFGTEFVEMNFTEYSFVKDARQSIKKDNVTRTFGPEPVDGKQFLLLRGTLKNLNNESLPVYDFFLGEFDLNGFKYEITANDCYVYDSNGQFTTSVEPLSTYNFIMWAEIPNELADQKPTGTFTFGFYDLFDNRDMAYHKSFDDDPISFSTYIYQLPLQ